MNNLPTTPGSAGTTREEIISVNLLTEIMQNNDTSFFKNLIRESNANDIRRMRDEINSYPGGLATVNANAYDEWDRTPGRSVFGPFV
jgi:hypothetical protein